MIEKVRARLTYANVMATIAVFLALGAGAYAATHLSKNSVTSRAIRNGQVKRMDLATNAVDASKIKDGTIGSADFSDVLKASLAVQCPSGLNRSGNICYEAALRPAATFAGALQTCAAAGRSLPSLGELTLVFNDLGAPQAPQWVATQYVDSNGPSTSFLGTLLSEDASRAIGFGYDSADRSIPHTQPYRCVTSPTN